MSHLQKDFNLRKVTAAKHNLIMVTKLSAGDY